MSEKILMWLLLADLVDMWLQFIARATGHEGCGC